MSTDDLGNGVGVSARSSQDGGAGLHRVGVGVGISKPPNHHEH